MSLGSPTERSESRTEVRSFHAVFDLERRIYRIDRLRLNPAGVPVRGVLYFLALLATLTAAAAIPLLGWPLARMPWFMRYLAVPGALATLLAVVRIDGRPFHTALAPLARLGTGPRTFSQLSPCAPAGTCWCPPSVVLIADGSDPRLRGFRYRGPGTVLISHEHERMGFAVRARSRGRRLARGRVVRVPAGAVLRVSGSPGAGDRDSGTGGQGSSRR